MICRIGRVSTALTILLAAGSVSAHHSFQTVFDVSKPILLTGMLTRVGWINPHVAISLDVKDDGGQTESWVIEAGPPSFFRSRDVARSAFENAVGQLVTVEALRARDNSHRGSLLKITFQDGKIVTSSPGA